MPTDPAAHLTDAHLPLRSDAAMQCHVYLLANRRQGTLYLGVTSNLVQRVWQHREGVADGFTRRYGVKMLMWFEGTSSIEAAIAREKQIKNWKNGNGRWR